MSNEYLVLTQTKIINLRSISYVDLVKFSDSYLLVGQFFCLKINKATVRKEDFI